jgi:murein endopeptidase
MRLPLIVFAAFVLGTGAAAAVTTASEPARPSQTIPPFETTPTAPSEPQPEPIHWRRSRALGKPFGGRLVRGVRLPAEGPDFFTWDPVLRRSPNRSWRRWGTNRLLRVLLRVLRAHGEEFPDSPRVGVGDLSRPHGGGFGRRFGGLGHASHQNGLDADVYYPRLDGLEREPRRVRQIDPVLAQDLVDRFVCAGAQYVFVGPHTGLTGAPAVVRTLRHHDDHMHVRIFGKRRRHSRPRSCTE